VQHSLWNSQSARHTTRSCGKAQAVPAGPSASAVARNGSNQTALSSSPASTLRLPAEFRRPGRECGVHELVARHAPHFGDCIRSGKFHRSHSPHPPLPWERLASPPLGRGWEGEGQPAVEFPASLCSALYDGHPTASLRCVLYDGPHCTTVYTVQRPLPWRGLASPPAREARSVGGEDYDRRFLPAALSRVQHACTISAVCYNRIMAKYATTS